MFAVDVIILFFRDSKQRTVAVFLFLYLLDSSPASFLFYKNEIYCDFLLILGMEVMIQKDSLWEMIKIYVFYKNLKRALKYNFLIFVLVVKL